MATNSISETALFVCSGGTSNVGLLTGQAGVEVVKLVGRGKAGLVCLAGLMTQAPSVIEKTNNARRIVTVDGCALNCARKIVEQAGYTPDVSLTLESDCGISNAPSLDYTEEELHRAVQAVLQAVDRNLVLII